MFRNISVRNFRGIDSAELTGLNHVTLITGLNDAGKTSLLEAMFLLATGPNAGAVAIQTLKAARGQPLNLSPDGTNPWDDLFRGLNTDLPIEIDGASSKGPYGLSLEAINQETVLPTSTVAVPGDNSPQRVHELRVTERSASGTRAYSQRIEVKYSRPRSGLEGTDFSLEMKLEPPVSAPFMAAAIVRPSVRGDLAAGYSELRRRRSSVDLLKALQLIDDRINSLEVLVESGRSELFADVEGALIPFQLLGDGPIAVASALIAMSSVKHGVLLIDEVGSGVHHSIYPLMWSVLSRAAQRLDVQIVATSHSAECIAGAYEGLGGQADRNLTVFRMRRPKSGAETDVRSYSGKKLLAALEAGAELR